MKRALLSALVLHLHCRAPSLFDPLFFLFDQSVFDCIVGQVGVRLHRHFFQDARSIRADRFHRKIQFIGDLGDRGAGRELAKDLELTLRQLGVQRPIGVARYPVGQYLRQRWAHILAPVNDGPDRADQLRRRGFLVELSRGAGAQSIDRILILGVGGQHQDG